MNKEEIKKLFQNNGIESIGIAPVGPYYELKKVLEDKVNKGLITGMEEPDIEKKNKSKINNGGCGINYSMCISISCRAKS